MMGFSDFHTHTTFSDGKNTPAETVEAAIVMGMPSIGISDHSYSPHDIAWSIKSDAKTVEYIRELNRLKRVYGESIDIFCGLEEDYYASSDLSKFDYSIGSVHHVYKNGEYLDVDKSADETDRIIDVFYGGDAYAYAEDYYALVGDVLRKTNADIIGHFDLITKFNEKRPRFDESEPRYRKAAIDALDSLLPYCRPFEVNTGAISRGYRTTPYPSRGLLEYINARGGCVILSSDSHRADTLNFVFEDALDIVRSVGFTPDRIYNDPFGAK